MKRAAFTFVALFATISAVGCGTLSNQHALGIFTYGLEKRDQRVYGGVRSDGEKIGDLLVKDARSEGEPTALIWIVPCMTLFYLSDMPLSFLADTLLLPWDIRAQWKRLTDEKATEVQPPPAEVSSPLKSLENNKFKHWQMTRSYEMSLPPKAQPDSQ